ncbi:hypothetical protein A3A49_01510 [Candidatus Curtissbacteria bacterium RIFCSPLOWO2_01_FULL_38_11b]|uniref:Uncharacterized protein n=1 Tax=Candidatus Curtissbacteria bacterium RIFCSPLOWO2_01_FULL_38_11b TaxID=1797725 RepID=A0A1F5H0J3_9BACT|nr:MAG: hypothetical protein A3A49_01510 [Candidatus Curtissbacteria bacterium RIFCSPLOWO2_01_FULL_38_11b]
MEVGEGLKKVVRASRFVVEKLDARPQLNFKDVGIQTIAGIVYTQMRNRVRSLVRKGERDNGFYVDDLLRNVKIKPDSEFPTSRQEGVVKKRVEDALDSLKNGGVLKEVGSIQTNPVPDRFFLVVDEQKLQEIYEGKITPEAKPA